jgi:hypothetical protein
MQVSNNNDDPLGMVPLKRQVAENAKIQREKILAAAAAKLKDVELKEASAVPIAPPNTPTSKKKRLDTQQQPQPHPQMWRSCCGETCSPAAVKYITQCVFGFIVVMLAGYMLAFTDENESLWASLFSSTVGLFLPHPSPPTSSTTSKRKILN